MEFSGKLTKEDLDDLAVLLRPKGYWFSFLSEAWHGATLFGLIVWATVLAFLGRTSPHWPGLGVIWLVIAGIVVWTAYSVRRDRQRDLTRLNATLPDRVQLTSEGIRWAPSSGGLTSLPWGELGGWRERGRVIALDNVGGAAAVFFSVAEMPELERQRLRDFLRSQVPPAPSFERRLDRTD
jgi:hypothetical protein